MDFRIADTFTDSLARLTGDEQKAAKTTAFDLQVNPTSPGLSFHKLDKAKDKNFWSVRVSRDIRLIVHRSESSLLLCYVNHHDDAYRWAERRKLEVHPKTGAAQFVVIRELVVEVPVQRASQLVQRKPRLFESRSETELLQLGVPQEWLADVKQADEDTLLDIAVYLPGEAAESLLQMATGTVSDILFSRKVGRHEVAEGFDSVELVSDDLDIPELVLDDRGLGVGRPPLVDSSSIAPHMEKADLHIGSDAFSHPDAQRRFRLVENREELERALDYPWEKWTTFLHPTQRELVERSYAAAARVSGSAGTGKTIVALHRAVFLARTHPESRVLLSTFSDTLAYALRTKLRRLISNEPRLAERLEVQAMNAIGERLYEQHFGPPRIAGKEDVRRFLADATAALGGRKVSPSFLLSEWEDLVDALQLNDWEAYRDVKRLGRKTRMPESQRASLWAIFDAVRSRLQAEGMVTHAGMFTRLAAEIAVRKNAPFDYVVVDEAQDVSAPQLRFLAALGGDRPNALFFAGDLGQRIFQQPFSWKSLGVDIRGRSRTLHINYRTSHQIRMQADRLLGPVVSDVDGNTEERRGTISVFNGPAPVIKAFDSQNDEIQAVAGWLVERTKEGLALHELSVFVRSESELDRARSAVSQAGLPFKVLDERVETAGSQVSISTMHLAKGLEFRAVAVMACDDEVIPLQYRIESIADESDLEEVYNTERHLLYVACTRARDQLLVTSVVPASEFLEDLLQS